MCKFEILLQVPAAIAIKNAKEEIEKHGGKFEGDIYTGSFTITVPFAGTLAGSYGIRQQVMEIQISKKPVLITCHRIKSEIEKYLQPQSPHA